MNIIAVMVAVIFIAIAIFQGLLAFGFPLAEYAMGGFNKVLPPKLRLVSVLNGIVLLLMAVLVLMRGGILNTASWLPVHTIIWVIAGFIALNTLANLFSTSKKEKYVMIPITVIAFLLLVMLALN